MELIFSSETAIQDPVTWFRPQLASLFEWAILQVFEDAQCSWSEEFLVQGNKSLAKNQPILGLNPPRSIWHTHRVQQVHTELGVLYQTQAVHWGLVTGEQSGWERTALHPVWAWQHTYPANRRLRFHTPAGTERNKRQKEKTKHRLPLLLSVSGLKGRGRKPRAQMISKIWFTG